jgi:hypothetical protein
MVYFFRLSFLRKQESSFINFLDSCFRRNDREMNEIYYNKFPFGVLLDNVY